LTLQREAMVEKWEDEVVERDVERKLPTEKYAKKRFKYGVVG
jgi:hypothetical protein